MGVSFKISKRGTKFKPPKPVISESTLDIEDGQHSLEATRIPSKVDSAVSPFLVIYNFPNSHYSSLAANFALFCFNILL